MCVLNKEARTLDKCTWVAGTCEVLEDVHPVLVQLLPPGAPQYLLPVVVVPGPLLGIGQHVVRLLDHLECRLGSLRIIGVLVGVILNEHRLIERYMIYYDHKDQNCGCNDVPSMPAFCTVSWEHLRPHFSPPPGPHSDTSWREAWLDYNFLFTNKT